MRTALALLLVCAAARGQDTYPTAVLNNGQVKLTVYLPDAKAGFYRGTRFDWSGVVGEVEIAGHKVFTKWKDKHDPTNFDDIVGPCEEFGTAAPLGYADAKEGETFLKIGVGALVKPKEEKYRFFHNYTLKYPGEWQVSAGTREVEFKQELLSRQGYGYRYTKKVILDAAGPAFTLTHELTNTGSKPIDTDVYNHNFFNVNGDPVGPNYAVQFGFPVAAPEPKERFAELVALNGNNFTFKKPLDTGSIYAELKGLKGEATDGRFSLRHTPTGVNLMVDTSLPVSKFNVWGVKGCLCPEPFGQIKLKPGDTAKWTTSYSFGGGRFIK